MHIGIHTGASGHFGLGHAVRCKALASALIAQGATVEFLTQTPALATFVAPFSCHTLHRDTWQAWQGDIVIQDVPNPWLSEVYVSLRHRHKVVRVDTLFATPQTCDLLIGPCIHWDPRIVDELRTFFGSRFLYGWDYVLLEEAVTRLPIHAPGPVVFCAGGSDPHGMLAQMLAWAGPPPADADWVALVPQYSTHIPILPSWVRIELFDRDFLRQAALLITTFGVTCYEALWWGVPTFMLGTSAATEDDAVRLMQTSRGAVRAVGTPEPGYPHTLRTLIPSIMEQRVERQRMTNASLGLLDGLGAQRCATAILALKGV